MQFCSLLPTPFSIPSPFSSALSFSFCSLPSSQLLVYCHGDERTAANHGESELKVATQELHFRERLSCQTTIEEFRRTVIIHKITFDYSTADDLATNLPGCHQLDDLEYQDATNQHQLSFSEEMWNSRIRDCRSSHKCSPYKCYIPSLESCSVVHSPHEIP